MNRIGKRNFIKEIKKNKIGKQISNHKVVLLSIHTLVSAVETALLAKP